MKFDLCIRKLGADGYDDGISDNAHLAAKITFRVFKEKNLPGCCAIFPEDHVPIYSRVYADDATRKQVRKRQCIVFTDLGIEKPLIGHS